MKAPTVAALAVIERDGLILGVSRRDDHNDFGLPGGKVEEGETAEQGMRRELKEETDLDVLSAVELTFRFPGRYANVTAFKVEVKGTFGASEEGIVKWCTRDELRAGTFGEYNRALFDFLG